MFPKMEKNFPRNADSSLPTSYLELGTPETLIPVHTYRHAIQLIHMSKLPGMDALSSHSLPHSLPSTLGWFTPTSSSRCGSKIMSFRSIVQSPPGSVVCPPLWSLPEHTFIPYLPHSIKIDFLVLLSQVD